MKTASDIYVEIIAQHERLAALLPPDHEDRGRGVLILRKQNIEAGVLPHALGLLDEGRHEVARQLLHLAADDVCEIVATLKDDPAFREMMASAGLGIEG